MVLPKFGIKRRTKTKKVALLSYFFIILAGTPATTLFLGTLFVTTAPAATIEFSPTVTPGKILAPAPIQTFFSKRTFLNSILFVALDLSCD